MNILNSILGTAGKVIDKLPSDNDKAIQANELAKTMEARDLQQGQQFGNTFNPKNPRSWAEVISVIAFALQLILIFIGSVLSVWGIKMDVSSHNIGVELLFAMLGLGGYRLADKRMGKK